MVSYTQSTDETLGLERLKKLCHNQADNKYLGLNAGLSNVNTYTSIT